MTDGPVFREEVKNALSNARKLHIYLDEIKKFDATQTKDFSEYYLIKDFNVYYKG